MINLLSPSAQKEFRAGRTNSLLIRYMWITFALFVLLAIMAGLTYFVLDNSKTSSEQSIAESDAKVADFQSTNEKATAFQANLSMAKSILDRQTNYSAILLKISQYMTAGTTLNSITLDSTTFGTPMNLQIFARDEAAAVALKNSFQASGLFSDVQFKSLSNAGTTPGYPLTAQLQITINKDAVTQ